jgi:peptidoglycan/xylan/chitin deacetylase (PgdA/CDA1 family)
MIAPAGFWTRVQSRYIRDMAAFAFKRPFRVETSVPYVSFTFDDFPRSALHTGGAILKQFGVAGTYYASFGLMGKQAPTGQMFVAEDAKKLLCDGHELGCHTFAHCDAWKTDPNLFEDSIRKNQSALEALVHGASFKTLSYPINPPRARTKLRVAKHFVCSRGGGQALNVGTTDLNYLRAFFIEKSREHPDTIKTMIDQNQRNRGWLIFATHDVSANPTPWGCTPELFADIVRYTVRSGATILPVIKVWEALRSGAL